MTDKILDLTRVQLSALFDGALGQDEARFLRKRLEHDTELAGCVSRWQLAGDILRGQATAAAPAGFAGRVAAAIAADSTHAQAAAGGRGRRWIPGAALAASVAVVAMFMARQSPDVLPADNPAPMEIASAAPAIQTPVESPAPVTPQVPDAAVQLVAAATVAAVEVPRRAAARRTSTSRGQAQRAAATRTARVEQVQPQVAVVNPFAPDAAISTRPWPRAILPNAGAAFNVGYGGMHPTRMQPTSDVPAEVHPFRPSNPSPR